MQKARSGEDHLFVIHAFDPDVDNTKACHLQGPFIVSSYETNLIKARRIYEGCVSPDIGFVQSLAVHEREGPIHCQFYQRLWIQTLSPFPTECARGGLKRESYPRNTKRPPNPSRYSSSSAVPTDPLPRSDDSPLIARGSKPRIQFLLVYSLPGATRGASPGGVERPRAERHQR